MTFVLFCFVVLGFFGGVVLVVVYFLHCDDTYTAVSVPVQSVHSAERRKAGDGSRKASHVTRYRLPASSTGFTLN